MKGLIVPKFKRPKSNCLLLLPFLLLSACKNNSSGPSSAEAEALDYVKLVQIALSNAYDQTGKPVPATPCTDALFGMKKTSKFLTLNSCTAKMSSAHNSIVVATFNDDLAILGDGQGTRRVKVSELPEVK